jgi:hypothetical protein
VNRQAEPEKICVRSALNPASTAALDSELQLHLELIREGRRKEDGIELGETVAADFSPYGAGDGSNVTPPAFAVEL